MRVKAVNIAGAAIQHAVYDASGERALKGHGTVVSLGMNGKKYQYAARMGNYVRYVSGYSVVDRYGQLSKHYYAGSERIASRLAGPSTDFVDAEDLEGDHVDALPALQQMDIRIPVQGWGIGLGQGSFENVPLPGDECDNYTPGSEEYKQCICEQEGTCEEVIYWYHPDHLGSSTFLTDRFGQPYQFVMYLPFGETFAEQRAAGFGTPYLFNAKELDEETGFYYYGARYYDPRVSMWWGVDPMAGKYPSTSPYVFSANNPIYYVDPDGREPVPSIFALNPWFSLKPTQWYSTAGVYDSKSFNSAAAYSTQRLRSDAFQTVYQRNAYYGWAQSQADSKRYGSKWFGAAQLVTGLNAVGATETPNLWIIKDNTEAFLKGGNKFLFSHNIKNAKDLLADGKLSGGFTDANGSKQSFEGLTGMSLDFKMVEFEQSKVQEYINSYKGNDLNSIIGNINDLFTGNVAKTLGPGAVNDVMKESFNGGKSFNFGIYEDRVKLGQELIKKAHNE